MLEDLVTFLLVTFFFSKKRKRFRKGKGKLSLDSEMVECHFNYERKHTPVNVLLRIRTENFFKDTGILN